MDTNQSRLYLLLAVLTAFLIIPLLMYIKPAQRAAACYEPVSTALEIKLGDKVPNMKFRVINNPDCTVDLSDLKGKLVILVFWATPCGKVVSRFKRIDSLQKQFHDQVQILLINNIQTGCDTSKMNYLINTWKKIVPRFNLLFCGEDKFARFFFLPATLPHYVWIGKNGKLITFSSNEELTAESISKALLGETTSKNSNKDFAEYLMLLLEKKKPL